MDTTMSYSCPNQPLYATSQISTTSTSPAIASNVGVSNDQIERVKKSQHILEKYPDRVPLIIEPSKNDRVSYPIDKSKYITPRRFDLGATSTNHS